MTVGDIYKDNCRQDLTICLKPARVQANKNSSKEMRGVLYPTLSTTLTGI